MKTVFITILEGVESKNLLRTGVVEKLLASDQNVQAVLFVKNKSRMDYYQAEFHHPRISYEIAEPYEPNWLNKFFGLRKFHFLQTETTDLRARINAQDRGKIYYYYSLLLHRLLARRLFVKVFRFLDLALVKDDYFDKYFDKYKPDLIFLANLFEDFEVNFLRSAKKYGVPSVGLINSWDRVTARCILRIVPDKLTTFNDIVKGELVETNYIHTDDIFASGLPQYDYYFSPVRTTRRDFLKKLGIDAENKVIFYSPIGGMFSNSDWDMIDLIYKLNNNGKFGEKIKIFVSFSPNDFIKKEELAKRPWLLYQHLGVRFSETRSTDWDMTTEELEELKNLLFSSDIVICYASSLSMDAAVFDKPIININFEIRNNEKLAKSPTVFYQMTHYKKALKVGGIKMVNSENELIEWVNKYLRDPSLDKEGRRALVTRQCKYLDGASAQRMADFLLKNL